MVLVKVTPRNESNLTVSGEIKIIFVLPDCSLISRGHVEEKLHHSVGGISNSLTVTVRPWEN